MLYIYKIINRINTVDKYSRPKAREGIPKGMRQATSVWPPPSKPGSPLPRM
jgi:hypothetical protein